MLFDLFHNKYIIIDYKYINLKDFKTYRIKYNQSIVRKLKTINRTNWSINKKI